MFWVNFLQKCHVIWILDTSRVIGGLEFLKYCDVLGRFSTKVSCNLDTYLPIRLLAWSFACRKPINRYWGRQRQWCQCQREVELIIENQSNSSFILQTICPGKFLSPVEMFGEISGDCRQMGIYLVSHISILPSQPSPPSLYFVNNTVHKEGKKKNNKVFLDALASLDLKKSVTEWVSDWYFSDFQLIK